MSKCECLLIVLLLTQCVCQEFPQEIGLYKIPDHGFDDMPLHIRYPHHHGHEGPVHHAGLPRYLAAVPMPLPGADHELMFNISWLPSMGNPARDYSLEVRSETRTVDCDTPMCYEYNIPGAATWWQVPQRASPVAGSCAVRPGCAYSVRLIAHPWDGHTSANLNVELDECVVGVCSCAHAPRLPAPLVQATTVTVQGDIFVNVTWSLPPPRSPQRLPPALQKRAYFVSIGKQMVSDAHPSPWFAHTITRKVDAEGLVFIGDATKWLLLPITSSDERRGERSGRGLDVRLLARVSLLDDRECMGPAGNSTAYDPVKSRKSSLVTYLTWASLGGVCALAMVAAIVLGSRSVKKVLNAFRPATAPAPLEPLRRRPAWLPLQLYFGLGSVSYEQNTNFRNRDAPETQQGLCDFFRACRGEKKKEDTPCHLLHLTLSLIN